MDDPKKGSFSQNQDADGYDPNDQSLKYKRKPNPKTINMASIRFLIQELC